MTILTAGLLAFMAAEGVLACGWPGLVKRVVAESPPRLLQWVGAAELLLALAALAGLFYLARPGG